MDGFCTQHDDPSIKELRPLSSLFLPSTWKSIQLGLARSLETIACGEGKLAETQAVLADNLRVLRETQQIDEALHGLTAAIHLMTARHNLPGTRGTAVA